MRKLSDNGLNFKKAWETFRGTAYKATEREKYYTIGWGHYGPDVKAGQKVTEGQALLLLNRDLAWAVKAVDDVAHPSLNQAQFDAMVDLVFNNGVGAIGATTGTGKALRAGDIATLRQKLPQFINQRDSMGRLVPMLGLKRRAIGRLALFDGKPWQEAEAIGRAVKSL